MKCTECGNRVKPVVGVDVDGTLGDWHGAFFHFAAEWLGIQPAARHRLLAYNGMTDIATHMGLDKRTYRQIKLAFRQSGLKRSMTLWPGAGRFLTFLRSEGVETWITTTRPYLQIGNMDEDTREWLRRNLLPYDHIIYDDDKYARLLEMVDPDRVVCIVEDQSEDWNRAYELGLNALFRRMPYNHGAQPTTNAVYDSMSAVQDAVSVLLERWNHYHAVA